MFIACIEYLRYGKWVFRKSKDARVFTPHSAFPTLMVQLYGNQRLKEARLSSISSIS